MSPNGQLQVANDINEQDAIFDCAWSENNEAHVSYSDLLDIYCWRKRDSEYVEFDD